MQIFITIGGDGGGDLYAAMAQYELTPNGLDPRIGVKMYFQNLDWESGMLAYYMPNLSKARNNHGAWVQFTLDPGPGIYNPTWAQNVSQAVSYYSGPTGAYWDQIINGSKDGAIINMCNAIKNNGLNHPDVNINFCHEGSFYWYDWSYVCNPTKWLNMAKHMLGLMRNQGIVCTIGLDFNNNNNDGVDVRNLFDATLLSYVDSFQLDPYFGLGYTQGQTNSGDGSLLSPLTDAIAYARLKGKKIDLPEMGTLYNYRDPANADALTLGYFQRMHDKLLAASDVMNSINLFVVQPEQDKVINGVPYYGSNAADFIRQIPRPYPMTHAYFVNTFVPHMLATTPGGGSPPPTPTGQIVNAAASVSGKTITFTGSPTSDVAWVAVYADAFGGTAVVEGATLPLSISNVAEGSRTYYMAGFTGHPVGDINAGPYALPTVVDSSAVGTIVDRAPLANSTDGINGAQYLTVPWPTGANAPHSGDFAILAAFIASDGHILTPPAGFTFHHRSNALSHVGIAIYTRVCDGSETGSVSVTSDWGLNWLTLQVKVGVDGIDAYSESNTLAGGAAITTPALTTTKANDIIDIYNFAVLYGNTTQQTWSPPSGMTRKFDKHQPYNNSSYMAEVAEVEQAGVGTTGTKTSSLSVIPSQAVSTMLAFRAKSSTVSMLSKIQVADSGKAGRPNVVRKLSSKNSTATKMKIDGIRSESSGTPRSLSTKISIASKLSLKRVKILG